MKARIGWYLEVDMEGVDGRDAMNRALASLDMEDMEETTMNSIQDDKVYRGNVVKFSLLYIHETKENV